MEQSQIHSENSKGSFKSLLIWQRAIELSLAAYKLTALFPDSEKFGLTSQLRRASVSVASNIAEGYGRSTRGEFIQFLGTRLKLRIANSARDRRRAENGLCSGVEKN